MPLDDERLRLTGRQASFHVRARGLMGKLLMFAAGAVVLVAAFMVSLVVFAVALMVGLLVIAYLWWKTRELRRQIREQRPGGRVIEGEAIRAAGSDDESRR